MKELFILLSPVFWSLKNNIIRLHRGFYRKAFFYVLAGGVFVFIITKLLNMGMVKLQTLSPDVFNVLLIKGYSLIFSIIFVIQVVNGFVLALNTYYQSGDLEVLFTSPVNRTALFFSRFIETHLKASWMFIIFGLPLLVSSGLIFHANFFFYLYSPVVFMLFSVIPVNIGAGMAIITASILHVGKIKKLMVSTSVIAVAIAVTLLRLIKPEKFVNPELFANVTLFVSELKTSSFILLPNRWLSESIFNFLNKSYAGALIYIALLFLTSYLTGLVMLTVFKKYHYSGWSFLQGGVIVLRGKKEAALPQAAIKKLTGIRPFMKFRPLLNVQSRTIVKKDIIYQTRDIKTLYQFLIVFALIIVYLFSIASLPLNWEYYAVRLKYTISFFNLGLILIIISALCSRLVYPAVLSEASALWIIKTSPITSNRYIWTKFLFFFIPIFLSGQILTALSFLFINVERSFYLLIAAATAMLSFSLVSMAIGFAVSDLRRIQKENSKDADKAGSTIYMIASVALILVTLAIEIMPTFLYLLKESAKFQFTEKAWAIFGATIFVLVALNIFIVVFSIKSSIKKINSMELV